MKLRAQRLAHRGPDRRQVLRELVDRMAQAVAQARSREERAPTFDRAVEAIGQDTSDPIRRLLVERRLLKLLIRLGKRYCTGLLNVAQMPEHAATDNGGEIDLVGETATVLLVGEEIRGQRQTAPGQHNDQTLVSERTDETIEGHR